MGLSRDRGERHPVSSNVTVTAWPVQATVATPVSLSLLLLRLHWGTHRSASGPLHHCPHLHFCDNAAVVLGTGRAGPLRVHELQGVGGSTSGAPSTLFLCEMTALSGNSAGLRPEGGSLPAISWVSLPWNSFPRCLGGGSSPHVCHSLKLPNRDAFYCVLSLGKLKSPTSLTCL